MRINMPVTNVEVPLRDDTLIVSKTDLKGQITYINKDFLDISGFTEAELIGTRTTSFATRTCRSRPLKTSGATSRRAPMDGLRQEPLQEWRLLLGTGHGNADPRERPGHRLYVGTPQGFA
jgi:PAS domain-containing protein